MAVKNETPAPLGRGNENEAPAAEATKLVDISTISGFHVVNAAGDLLGTYETAEDAEAFADAHPRPNGVEVTIVEGKA